MHIGRGGRLPRTRPGAASWLIEAVQAGVRRITAKTAEAVSLSKLYVEAEVDRALGTAAVTGRFAEADLLSIVDYQATRTQTEPVRRSETHTLQPGTSAWSALGQTTTPAASVSEYDESEPA